MGKAMTYPAANGACAVDTNLHNAISSLKRSNSGEKSGQSPIKIWVVSS
jgi:hypothetical protein